MNFGKRCSFFFCPCHFHFHVLKSTPSSTTITYPGRLQNLGICSWKWTNHKEVSSLQIFPHGKLSCRHLCSVFFHHLKQVHSANHVDMIPSLCFPSRNHTEISGDFVLNCSISQPVPLRIIPSQCHTLIRNPTNLSPMTFWAISTSTSKLFIFLFAIVCLFAKSYLP